MNNHYDMTCTRDPGEGEQRRVSTDPRLLQSVDPGRCRLWSLHPRDPRRIDKRTCRDLIKSVAAYGQFIPAIGRPVRDDRQIDVEILCGARRLFVARHLGIPLLVQVRELSDWEAALAIKVENTTRRSLSRDPCRAHFPSAEQQTPIGCGAEILQHPNEVIRTSDGGRLFTARRYFNVLELVFPASTGDITIELVKQLIADFLGPKHALHPRGYRRIVSGP
jgi:hypothetical protein